MKKYAILGGMLMMLVRSVQAEIRTVSTVQEVQAAIDSVLNTVTPEDVLVALDIDQTLTTAINPVAQGPTIRKYMPIFKEALKGRTPAQTDWILCWGIYQAGAQMAEPGTAPMVAHLQHTGVKTIAFTARLVAPLKGTKPFLIETIDTLKALGLDFSKTFEALPSKQFDQFPPLGGGVPTFYRGVLSANGDYGAPENVSKGTVMAAFLAWLKTEKPSYTPKVVILVDDKKSHLTSMETALGAYDPTIQFLGLEYTAGRNYSSGDVSEEDFRKFLDMDVPDLG